MVRGQDLEAATDLHVVLQKLLRSADPALSPPRADPRRGRRQALEDRVFSEPLAELRRRDEVAGSKTVEDSRLGIRLSAPLARRAFDSRVECGAVGAGCIGEGLDLLALALELGERPAVELPAARHADLHRIDEAAVDHDLVV